MATTRALFLSLAFVAAAGAATAQTPKRGGMMTLPTENEPANFDCTGAGTIFSLAYVGPHYSLLVRYDQNAYPKIVGDLAESWTVSPDALTYTFKLRPNVKFHDGSTLTAEDIKATYDRIRNPPAGIASFRRAEFVDVASIDVIDPLTVAFKLSQRNSAMLSLFANPFNCIYSARKLAENPKYPETTVVGTGPFQFVEYVKGQSWTGKRFDGYFRPGLPYLDGFKVVVMSQGAPINAMAAGQIDAMFRTLGPQEIDTIQKARGNQTAFRATVINTQVLITINTQRKPYDDVRVRRALALALDRRGQIEPIKKITSLADIGGLIRPGYDMALPMSELEKIPGSGYSPDVAASRAEARRLLAEAGQSNLKFKLLNRPQQNPWVTIGLFAIDQWRQIGVTAEADLKEQPIFLRDLGAGDFDVSLDTISVPSEDPTIVLVKLTPNASNNYGKFNDPMLGDLFAKQKVALNDAERRPLINAFERQVLSQAYVIPMFWAGWTGALGANFHGWQPTPNYFLGYDLTEVWRD